VGFHTEVVEGMSGIDDKEEEEGGEEANAMQTGSL
jgi:hypothetical protein